MAQELNPATRLFDRNTTGLALNFAGKTAGVVGLNYFFHKTGHHKMERVIALVNIGGSAAAVSFDLTQDCALLRMRAPQSGCNLN